MAMRTASKSHVRRWGSGTAAIVRLLVAARTPMTGVGIGRAVGVTQPRVSQVLNQLAAADAVRATSDGYVGRRGRLIELYGTRARPTLIDGEAYWYSTRRLIDQARRIVGHAPNGSVAFSADVGPDLLAPWRHPTLAVVYTSRSMDLRPAGFVPAEGRADASVILRRTSDATLLAPAVGWPAVVGRLPLTDPVQQWADLLDLGGEDRREAANRLRHAILDRTIGKPA